VIRRPLLAAVACLAAVLVLTACGEKKDDLGATPKMQKVTLLLDYLPNADHAPIYVAKADGAFKKAGLDVTIRTPTDAATPLKLLAAHKADIVISYEPDLLLARDKAATVQGIGALITQPLTSLISLPAAKITSPADLAGKTVSTAGIPYQDAYLQAILTHAGVDPGRVKEVNVNFNLIPSILGKHADATLGAFWNIEGVQLQRAHKNPVILKMDKVGVPTYDELVFVAREDTVRKNGEMLRRFIQAVQTGANAVKADPTVGVDALLAADPSLKRADLVPQVTATLPAFFPAKAADPYGWMDPDEWRAYGAWMQKNQLLKNPPNSAAFTNEFLPGEGGETSDDGTPGESSDGP
jgi:putative hydroxymethylpyrimidine transport system substrate-binding protein